MVATSEYSYDFNGNETQILHKSPSGAVLAEYDYAFDPAGDLVSETDNGVTTNYQYDSTGQLVGYGSVTQSYDPNGNRNGSGYVVGPDNQLLSDGTWDYTYDAEGNEATKTNISTGVTWAYGYDNKNELVSAVETAPNGTVEVQADYKYDVFGNRLEKDVYTPAAGTAVTKYAYDAWNPNVPSGVGNENWNVWADLDANNNLVTRYFRGDALDQVFAQMGAGGSVAWYLTDNLGSTRVLVNNSGNVLDEINYDAFGNITSQTNPAAEPQYMYTGQEWDVETELQYSRARYYDPSTGRWISQDPMGFDAGDSNLYRYANNQPVVDSDPSGLLKRTVVWLTPEEMKAKGISQTEINWLKKIKAPFAPTHPDIIKGAGLKGDPTNYVLDVTKVGPKGKEVNVTVIRDQKTGEVVRVGWALTYKGVAYGFEFFDNVKEMQDTIDTDQVLRLTATRVIPFLLLIPFSLPNLGAAGAALPAGRRLVVGGGRAPGFPQLRPGDVALNVERAANPHVVGNIQTINPARLGRFNEVLFERVPFDQITEQAARNAAAVLNPGGRLSIITGRLADRAALRAALERAGFRNIQIRQVGAGNRAHLEITGTRGGG